METRARDERGVLALHFLNFLRGMETPMRSVVHSLHGFLPKLP